MLVSVVVGLITASAARAQEPYTVISGTQPCERVFSASCDTVSASVQSLITAARTSACAQSLIGTLCGRSTEELAAAATDAVEAVAAAECQLMLEVDTSSVSAGTCTRSATTVPDVRALVEASYQAMCLLGPEAAPISTFEGGVCTAAEQLTADGLALLAHVYGDTCDASSRSTATPTVCEQTAEEILAQLEADVLSLRPFVEETLRARCGGDSYLYWCTEQVATATNAVAALLVGALAGGVARACASSGVTGDVTAAGMSCDVALAELGSFQESGDPCATLLGCSAVNPLAPVELPAPETLTDDERADQMVGAETSLAAQDMYDPLEVHLGDMIVTRDTLLEDAIVTKGTVVEADGSSAAGTAMLLAEPINDGQTAFRYLALDEVPLDESGGFELSAPLTAELAEVIASGDGTISFMLVISGQAHSYTIEFVRRAGLLDGELVYFDPITNGLPVTSTIRLALDEPGVGPAFGVSTSSSQPAVPPPPRSHSGGDCQNKGIVKDQGFHYAAIGEMHTGSNFKGIIEYIDDQEVAKSTTFQIAISYRGVEGPWYGHGETLTKSSKGSRIDNFNNPFPRSSDYQVDGLFRWGTYEIECVRWVCSDPCTMATYKREYRYHWSTKPQYFADDIQPGDYFSGWSRAKCRDATTKKWGKRKPGAVVNFLHHRTNKHAWESGYGFLGFHAYTINANTQSLGWGWRLIPADGAPYIICGYDAEPLDASRVFDAT